MLRFALGSILILLASIELAPIGMAAQAATPAETPPEPQYAPSYAFPLRRDVDGDSVLMYEPQIRSWPDFTTFEAWVAIEVTPKDGAPTRYGTATMTGATEVDLDTRMVTVKTRQFTDVQFTDTGADSHVATVKRAVASGELDIPLDVFLSYLADEVLASPPPEGFNTSPPPIHVKQKPTILLFVNGEPVLADFANTGLKVVANANWPTFRDVASNDYYLLDDALWFTAKNLKGPWAATQSIPAGFEKLALDGEHASVRAAVPPKPTTGTVPEVIVTQQPAELIVIDGKPTLEAIPQAERLYDVSNTDSPLFKLDSNWYLLVAGRWFTTTQLERGPWRYVTELPSAFAQIPEDSPNGAVLASVPGTVEARMASLEALLPTKVTAPRDGKPPIEVTYAGEPKFEPIEGTLVARAVNTGYDIIELDGRYYLCYAGIWYDAAAPIGPWSVATSVPDAIYSIPPSSPSYDVTQVKVVESTATTVVYEYPPAYSSSVYVVYGVPYYGTGWYYPPYIYGGYYYPYWGSYGHGSWYNPATGGYGSRSVWYGPYGGYSYTQGYNPATGRYGYRATAWDGSDRVSYSEKYNQRTGVYTETGRHYNADNQLLHTERTRVRGDQWTGLDRSVDLASGTSEVRRATSGGGSSQVQRQLDDGTLTTSGTVTSGDGRTATIEGERTVGQGGTTTITGSEGGQAIIASGGGHGTTTIAQSGSGDLYAGHNGNVYKRTDSGWAQYDNGNWQQVDTPQRGEAAGDRAEPRIESQDITASSNRTQPRSSGAGGTYDSRSRDMQQLDRDYSARQRGNRQYEQRRSMGGTARMGGQRMGGGRGGGGRRR